MQSYISWTLSAAALLAAAWIIYHGSAQWSRLERAVGQLSASLNNMLHLLRPVPDRETFARDFVAIDDALQNDRGIAPIWIEFRRSLFLADTPAEICGSRPASDLFNDALPYRSGVDLRSFDSVPNQLVGLGLLFTFIGLLASLWVASTGIDGEFAQVKATLVQLLAASAFKFITSIAAIFASLNFIWRKNMLLAELSRVTEAVSAELERLVRPVTTEQLGAMVRSQVVRQTEILERGSGDMAAEIARQLDATLRENLGTAIAPVAEEINAMAGRISEINEGAMRFMIQRFAETLGGAARKHNEEMATLLDRVSRTVEDVPVRIDQASARFAASVAAAADDIDGTLKRSGAALAALLEETTIHVEASAGAFRTIVEQLGLATDRLAAAEASVVQRSERAEAGVRAAIEQLGLVLERTDAASTALEPLASLALRLERLAEMLAASTAGVNEFVARSDGALQESRRAGEALASSAAAFSAGVRELESSLAGVFAQIGNGIDGLQTKIGHVVGDMEDHMASAVDSMSDAVARLGLPTPPPARRPKRPKDKPDEA